MFSTLGAHTVPHMIVRAIRFTTDVDLDGFAVSDLHPVVCTRGILNTVGPRVGSPCDAKEKNTDDTNEPFVLNPFILYPHALALLQRHCATFAWATTISLQLHHVDW